MRFLVLGFRRQLNKEKHHRRHLRLDEFVHVGTDVVAIEDDSALDVLLRELAEDPFDVWARRCAPQSTAERDHASRPRRFGKRRVPSRRRTGARN